MVFFREGDVYQYCAFDRNVNLGQNVSQQGFGFKKTGEVDFQAFDGFR